MPMLRLFAVVIAAALTMSIAPIRAQNAGPTYVVSYIDFVASGQRAAVPVLRALRDASRKEAGNRSFEVLQGIGRPQQFAILEVWDDAKAQASHAAASAQLRDRLKPYLAAPIDERVHTGFLVGQGKAPGSGSVFVLTHVDLIGAKKDDGLAALKQLSADSAKDNGVQRFDVWQQGNRPNHLTLIEAWSGKAALAKHEEAAHTRKFREALLPMSGSLYDQRVYQKVN